MTPHHHEVHLLAERGVDDRLSGVALPDEEGHADTPCPAACHELLRRGFAPGPNLVDAGAEPAARQPQGPRIDHADDQQFGAQPAREIKRLETRLLGCRREVGREENPARLGEGTRESDEVRHGAHVIST